METNDHETGRRIPRSRLIRDTANLSPIRLTPRDFELLTALSEYRLLTTTQIRKLFFRSRHRARKRLFKLWQHKLVDRLFRPVSLGDRPSDVIYKLALHGARLLARHKGFSEEAMPEARRIKKLSSLFLDHTLAVNDFRIALERSCRETTDARLVYWREGKAIRFEQTIIDRSRFPALVRVPVQADGLFCVEINGHRHCAFVEIDLGTVTLGRWQRRFAAYARAYQPNLLPRQFGFSKFSVLIVTTGDSRMQNLRRIAKHHVLRAKGTNLYLFSHLGQISNISASLLTDKFWYLPHFEEPTSFLKGSLD